MRIKLVLLAGAALCAISAGAAFAEDPPHIHIAAMHKGGVVKSAMHSKGATNLTYTYSVSTDVSTKNSYKVKYPLLATYYSWENNDSFCSQPARQKLILSTRKTKYARLGTSVESYTYSGCSAKTKFYGDTYELTTKKAAEDYDGFSSTLSATFVNGGVKYKGKLTIDVFVAIY